MNRIIDNLNFINSLYNSINLSLCLLTFILNSLIIYIIAKKFIQKTTELKLILILSYFEIFLGLEQAISSLLKLHYGYHFFDAFTLPCLILGFMYSLLIRLEILFVTILALWRYLLVVHNVEKSLKFYLIVYISASSPMICFYLYSLYVLDQKPSPSYIICLSLNSQNVISKIFAAAQTFWILIPCWFNTYCYFSIGWKAYKKLNEMLKEAKAENNSGLMQTIKSEKAKLALQLTMMFFIYNISFSPSYITHVLKIATGYKRTPFVDFIAVLSVETSIVLNPLITISFQPDLNNELKLIFIKFKLKIKSYLSNLIRS
jgi:hypothetical protein